VGYGVTAPGNSSECYTAVKKEKSVKIDYLNNNEKNRIKR